MCVYALRLQFRNPNRIRHVLCVVMVEQSTTPATINARLPLSLSHSHSLTMLRNAVGIESFAAVEHAHRAHTHRLAYYSTTGIVALCFTVNVVVHRSLLLLGAIVGVVVGVSAVDIVAIGFALPMC